MKITNDNQLREFLAAVAKCNGNVYLKSPDGDVFNLKSTFSQYVAVGNLLSENGDMLELECSASEDEQNFYEFFDKNPGVR